MLLALLAVLYLLLLWYLHTHRTEPMTPSTRKLVLIKAASGGGPKDPDNPKTSDELLDLVIHINKVATGIKSGKYEPKHDAEFNELALNLYRLASEIRTFTYRKINHIEGSE